MVKGGAVQGQFQAIAGHAMPSLPHTVHICLQCSHMCTHMQCPGLGEGSQLAVPGCKAWAAGHPGAANMVIRDPGGAARQTWLLLLLLLSAAAAGIVVGRLQFAAIAGPCCRAVALDQRVIAEGLVPLISCARPC